MGIWTKYLIVGWSLITVGIILVSFQIMKYDLIKEDYELTEFLKTSETTPKDVSIEGELFKDNAFGEWAITKSEFISRIKNSEGIRLRSNHKIQYQKIYLYLPIYGFVVWSAPICVFALLGFLFGKAKTNNKQLYLKYFPSK